MSKKLIVKDFFIYDLTADECAEVYNHYELKILLYTEPDCDEMDIILDNMELDFVEGEYYEYAAVVRDEIIRRNKVKNSKNIPL